MNTEQERAEFEEWAQNSFELHRHSAGEYSSNFTQTAWAAWQAGRAALQSQPTNRWYAIDNVGLATLCADKQDAIKTASEAAQLYPKRAPYVVARMVPADAALQSQDHPNRQGRVMDKLFCDLKTDEEKAAFFLSGRGYETGVISQAIQNDVAMAYHRCVEYKKEIEALQSQDREDALRYRWLRNRASTEGICVVHIDYWSEEYRGQAYCEVYDGEFLDKAIDHARRIEGE